MRGGAGQWGLATFSTMHSTQGALWRVRQGCGVFPVYLSTVDSNKPELHGSWSSAVVSLPLSLKKGISPELSVPGSSLLPLHSQVTCLTPSDTETVTVDSKNQTRKSRLAFGCSGVSIALNSLEFMSKNRF